MPSLLANNLGDPLVSAEETRRFWTDPLVLVEVNFTASPGGASLDCAGVTAIRKLNHGGPDGPEVRLWEALDEPAPPKGHLANLGTAS